MDPTLASTREHQLLVDLSAAVEAGDEEEFGGKVRQSRLASIPIPDSSRMLILLIAAK
jgi:hypothetical protein